MITLIIALIMVIIVIVKSFIRYVQIDSVVLRRVLGFAAGEIIEINVNTYAMIGGDFNGMLAGADDEGLMVGQLTALLALV